MTEIFEWGYAFCDAPTAVIGPVGEHFARLRAGRDHSCLLMQRLPGGEWQDVDESLTVGKNIWIGSDGSTSKPAGLIDPNACAFCDVTERIHFNRWAAGADWHVFTQPTDEQRLERMKARRLAAMTGAVNV